MTALSPITRLVRVHWKSLLSCCGLGVAGVFLFVYDPRYSSLYPPCIFKKLTGLDCPGCGSARALHSLLHGHFGEAARQNVLFFPALLLVFSGLYTMQTSRGQALWNFLNKPRLVLALLCIFWVLRNIPSMPFAWLHSGG